MRHNSKLLMFIFAAFVLLQFALLQYVAISLPPQLEFQSNFINESTPFNVEETLVETTVAPPTATNFKKLTRGIDS